VNALVDRLKTALQAWGNANESTVVAGPPAGEAAIAALETKLAWKLPPDYRAFLGAVDGIRLDAGSESAMLDLFPTASLPVARDDDQRETLGEDGVELDAVVIIGAVPMHNIYVFLDKTTGETVKWMHFDATRFASFDEFLAAEIDGITGATA
jgi:hypothetical protein